MQKGLNDGTDAYSSSDADCDIRACAKIRIEDQQAQEFVGELSREFLAFARSLSAEVNDHDRDSGEGKGGHESAPKSQGAELGGDLIGDNGLELEQPVIKRLLKFFCDCYDKFIHCDISREGRGHFANKDRRKKRLLLEALIMMFKRFLASKESLNLRKLLEEQIKELKEALEREVDPEVRKILQERLSLLMRLQVQMRNARSTFSLEQFFLILAANSISHATLSAQRSVIGMEKSITYAATMARLMDVERIALRGSTEEIGSMHAAAACVYGYQSSMDRCVADLCSAGMLVIRGDEKVLFTEQLLLNAQMIARDLGNRVAGRLMTILDQAMKAIANSVIHLAKEVFRGTIGIVTTDITARQVHGRERAPMHEQARRAEQAAFHSTQRDKNIPGQSIPEGSFHQQAYVQFEHKELREKRYERSFTYENSEGVRCNAYEFGYSSVHVTTQYSSMQLGREPAGRNPSSATPGHTLESVTIVAVEQQIVMESQQVTR